MGASPRSSGSMQEDSGFEVEQDTGRFQTTARCGLAQHCAEERAGETGGAGAFHASGEGSRGYLLLHSAFGPSSMQLREKTEPEGGGRGGDRTRVRSVVLRGKDAEMDQR